MDAMSHRGEYSVSHCVVTALEQIRRVSINITADRKRAARQAHQSQFEQIKYAEEALHQDWTDLDAWDRLNDARAILEESRMEKLDKVRNSNAARWITVGDRCSKDFFEFHKECGRKTLISDILDGPRSIRDPKEISLYVQNYFQELYKNDQVVERNIQGRRDCL